MPDPIIARDGGAAGRLGAVLAAAILCIALVGCAASPPSLIVLQDPESGRIVPCGPPPETASATPAADAARCAASFERQGYRPLPVHMQ
jgi:hypothetical protein